MTLPLNTIICGDCLEVMKTFEDKSVDLVLTDQNMPRMDGLTLVRHLRTLPHFKSTPILILTTESSDEMKQAGRAAGATGWMVKPFDPRKLIEVIRKVLPATERSASDE